MSAAVKHMARPPGQSHRTRELLVELGDKLAPLRAAHQWINQRHFSREYPKARLFFGVFKDCDEALHVAPRGVRIGHDHPEVADRHVAELGWTWPSDYPVLFWLAILLERQATVFDLGGNVGLLFYLCRRYPIDLEDVRWMVCEVPAVARYGRQLAAEYQERSLSFTTEIGAASDSDILIASGCLQFILPPLWTSLSQLASKPRHLLLNRVPLWKGEYFVTLHNLGPAICPYQVWNEEKFAAEFTGLGYQLLDSWKAPEFSCAIPFHPERHIDAYSGLYFGLEGSGVKPSSRPR